MDLFEIEGKELLRRFDIPVSTGTTVSADTDPASLSYPLMLKAQVLSGHRGQAGGIRKITRPEDFRREAQEIMSLRIRGRAVRGLLAEPLLDIDRELYLGITLDSGRKQAVMIFTAEGGMEIEELARSAPEKLLRLDVSDGFDADAFRRSAAPLLDAAGLSCDDARPAAKGSTGAEGLPGGAALLPQLTETAEKLTRLYTDCDATTAEINPLAVRSDGTLTAADAKLVIDDNALYRQQELPLFYPREKVLDEAEQEAAEAGLVYVELDPDGNVGIIAGGAGIGMATVDTLEYYGGRAYNFLDLGGGVTAEKTCAAARLLLKNPAIEMLLVNVFGGINNCKTMAEGIVSAMKELNTKKPVMVKSRGHGQEEGWKLLREAGCMLVKYGTTDDAVRKLLEKTAATAPGGSAGTAAADTAAPAGEAAGAERTVSA